MESLASRPCNSKAIEVSSSRSSRSRSSGYDVSEKRQIRKKVQRPTRSTLVGCPVLDIFGIDVPMVHTSVQEFVGSIGRHASNLDRVVELVVHLTIGTLHLRDLICGDAIQVRFDIDKMSHAICG